MDSTGTQRRRVNPGLTPGLQLLQAQTRANVAILRNNIPGFKGGASLQPPRPTPESIRGNFEVSSNSLANARIIGLGNFNNQSRGNEGIGNSPTARFQRALSFTSFDRASKPGVFQFTGQGGAQGAQSFFNSLGATNIRTENTKRGPGTFGSLNFGNGSRGEVNIRPGDNGATRVEIQITTSRPGSRIKTRSNVKINFEEPTQ